MIRVTIVDRITGLTLRPPPPPSAEKIERARRRHGEAFDWLAQEVIEGRQPA